MTRGFVFSKDCETLRRFVIDDSSCAELHWVARLVTAWQTLKCRAAAYLLSTFTTNSNVRPQSAAP